MSARPCSACKGARLKPEVLAVTVGDLNIHELTRKSVKAAIEFADALELTDRERHIAARILKEIRARLDFLDNVGVGYLQLDRAASTLSGGEAQRIRLATQIGSQLVGVLYILDEPSIGLHQRDNDRLIGTLDSLRDLGNTVLVVEHDEQMMRAADHLIDIGPGAGEHGGAVVAQGRRPRSWSRFRARSPGNTSRASGRSPCPSARVDDRRRVPRARRADAQPQGHRRGDPARQARLRHRRVGLGQVDARQRDRLQGARATGSTGSRVKPGEHDGVEGDRAASTR